LLRKSREMDCQPQVFKEELVHSERWLRLKKLHYVDAAGKQRIWECAERTTRGKSGVDAVAIFAILKKKNEPDRTLLIKQFRPPMDKFTIEMPAGLVDVNETVENAAIRELKEETGYVASHVECSPIIANDPGMANSNQKLAIATVDLDSEENKNVEPEPDDGEYIETYIVEIREFLSRLKEFSDQGMVVDSRVWYFGQALHLASLFQR